MATSKSCHHCSGYGSAIFLLSTPKQQVIVELRQRRVSGEVEPVFVLESAPWVGEWHAENLQRQLNWWLQESTSTPAAVGNLASMGALADPTLIPDPWKGNLPRGQYGCLVAPTSSEIASELQKHLCWSVGHCPTDM